MSRTTTALVVTSIGGPFELREVRLDSIRPDEALVEIHATGVCHTDLSSADGTLPGAAGAILGHEGKKKIEDFLFFARIFTLTSYPQLQAAASSSRSAHR